MAKRPCLDCGALTTRTRCPTHERERQAARNQARPGHRAAHRQARAQWAPTVNQGRALCYRCGQPISADAAWDIDNTPNGWHPSHATCNRAAGGRTAAANAAAKSSRK